MYNIEKEYATYAEQIGGKILLSGSPKEDIRKTRSTLGITQEELGRFVRLRRETISRIENGIINPTFDFVKKFSRVIAATKVIRDLHALNEISAMSGRSFALLSPSFLRSCFSSSLQDVELIFEVSTRGYRKSRAKILRKIKSGV